MKLNTSMSAAEEYLRARTGSYHQRKNRYRVAGDAMVQAGLNDESLVVDLGAGWTELDYYLRVERGWRGRYWPVDAMFDGTDLDLFVPPRPADFFVALEVLEHLRHPLRLLRLSIQLATRGVVVSVPNPDTTDVLGMDPTHKSVITSGMLEACGMTVEVVSCYGNPNDTLFAVFAKE